MVESKGEQGWQILGRPPGGTVSAMAIAQNGDLTVFIGAGTGLYRATGLGNTGSSSGDELPAWERLPLAPLGIMCLAISPQYARDHTLAVGTHTGIFVSRDGGETWLEAKLPLSRSMVLALGFSPGFATDGVLLAGTLEDGILFSDTQGVRWASQSFGLLDATVFVLALSPGFLKDGLAFAGTDSALYYTYNHGRAWKPLPFPQDAAPVLSLAVSPEFPEDHTLYAGTEQHGLYCSSDGGQSWLPLGLPAASVNALLVPQKDTLLAATAGGVFQSRDRGQTWECLLDLPDALSLAAQGNLYLAGVIDQGVWLSRDQAEWKPIANLSTRSLTGLLLSPQFEKDGLAFMHGFQEGLWRTTDGGRTWNSLNEALPSPEIHALAMSPWFPESRVLVAACSGGLLRSENAGDTWNMWVEEPSTAVVFSPNGKILAAAFQNQGICASSDLGESWQPLPGPWESGGKVLGISITNQQHCYIAYLEGMAETVSLWQGKPGQMQKVLSQPASENPLVCFWIPSQAAADRPWYASLGNTVWQFSARSGRLSADAAVFPAEQNENILALTGIQGAAGPLLFACTGPRLYRSADAKNWTLAHDFGNERAISIVLSPSYRENGAIYALLLGGSFCKGIL